MATRPCCVRRGVLQTDQADEEMRAAIHTNLKMYYVKPGNGLTGHYESSKWRAAMPRLASALCMQRACAAARRRERPWWMASLR